MDDEVKLSLEKTVVSNIQNIIDSGYVLIKDISVQGFNEETNIAKVFCSFGKSKTDENPLEKYYRYKLDDDGTNYSWHYIDSDG